MELYGFLKVNFYDYKNYRCSKTVRYKGKNVTHFIIHRLTIVNILVLFHFSFINDYMYIYTLYLSLNIVL